jgi:hypothetical protein
MKTIQMTIDEPLLAKVDQAIKELEMTRSAFIREALELALRHYQILEMEKSTPPATPAARSSRASLMSSSRAPAASTPPHSLTP